jgi:hypothetical protein
MLLIMAAVPRPDKPSSRYRIRRIPKFDFARSIFGNMGIPFFSRVLAVAGENPGEWTHATICTKPRKVSLRR